ncbi:MAG: alcohol dehydrogenase catalytic domain-containing protein [Fimbriimonadales bacterium]|jgi:threonine dehydrogenase-like Zn-dependent dehydrogenase|nr:alcohol dehydrogenase catalytic domain-containing protein [Fimbriimonadales bacterium]GBC89565.1 Sorbitol dehydrogenase [bacterium HR14]GIV13682.1 MAG: hypothetical protein KatS3mg021_1964 [Fimbriimonadales bacterium]CUU02224.1 D-arabinose 1-dehydrogenase, Zn-dependent alcohol dehydrogenase family [Armatimonadetes bacterium GBS]CUU35617.1 D-arabinose 1-dehydrogenase, Zn-dependent alcohol dehydrogenase family [Armatimonadetes bacterium GXS]
MNAYERYQQTVEVPPRHWRWNLYGAGLENLGRNGAPEYLPTPAPTDTQLLVRIDAVGICFSDLKILRLGGAHPKIARDLSTHPVVMGHEIACTVAQVGSALTDRFHVGERYIVQADVYVGGRVQAVGYALEGGYTQYALMTEPVLNGDAGCYLLPCPNHLSYAEAALVEPWACVVASYRIAPAPLHPAPEGDWLVVLPHAPAVQYRCSALQKLLALSPPHRPSGAVVILQDTRGAPLSEAFQEVAAHLGKPVVAIPCAPEKLYDPATLQDALAYAQGGGFRHALVFGDAPAPFLEAVIDSLVYGGYLSFTCHRRLAPVPVDAGRLHYDRLMILATSSWDITDALSLTRSTALRKGDRLLLFGAGGSMGQMHLHYALSHEPPPAQVVVVDRHPERLEPLRALGEPLASERGITLQFYCNAGASLEEQFARLRELAPHGFDQVMLLASSPDAVPLAYSLLTDGGILNLFAGIPRGQKTPLDLTLLATRHMRLMGSSGSTMDDIRECLDKTASGALPTRKVLTAVGGLNTLPEALTAVQEHRYLGKVVLYPHLPRLPLQAITALSEPVRRHLESERYWTREAEEALFNEWWKQTTP